jgi:hypothetical protein
VCNVPRHTISWMTAFLSFGSYSPLKCFTCSIPQVPSIVILFQTAQMQQHEPVDIILNNSFLITLYPMGGNVPSHAWVGNTMANCGQVTNCVILIKILLFSIWPLKGQDHEEFPAASRLEILKKPSAAPSGARFLQHKSKQIITQGLSTANQQLC